MYSNLPNSCLIGIVLTISTHSGPQVVYHYPPVNEPVQLTKEKLVRDFGSRGSKLSQARSRNAGAGKGDINGTEEVYDGVSSSSDNVPDATSGLSESELSTDYVDCSSSSSESESESELGSGEEERNDVGGNSSSNEVAESNVVSPILNDSTAFNHMLESQSVFGGSVTNAGGTLNTARSSVKPKSVKSRHSQMSTSRLFHYLSNNSDPAESWRPSMVSKVTSAEELDNLRMNEGGNNFDMDSLLAGLGVDVANVDVSDIMDERLFQLDYFQDVSKIFNFDAEFVAEICSPPKEMCNTRFEFTVDDLCFLGLPIHVDEQGRWRRKKSKKCQTNTRSRRSASLDGTASDSNGVARTSAAVGDTRKSGNSEDFLHDGEQPGKPNAMTSEDEGEEDLQKAVNMFHVCFIMNPQLVEYNERVDDMYHYIVTRLSLVLRYIQDRTGYVVRECAKILKTRDAILKSSETLKKSHGQGIQGKFLYECILKSSSLARALTKCFHSIVNSEIVTLHIDKDKVLSLQIPVKNEFSTISGLKTNSVLRGSYLTSILNANFLEQPPDPVAGELGISDHYSIFHEDNDILDFALLLLDDAPNVIKELESSSFDNDLSHLLMITLVKNLKPTLPLRSYLYLLDQILGNNRSASVSSGGAAKNNTPTTPTQESDTNSFRCSMLRSIALHLTYWRHTRIIFPINSKNTYIVSPLAPICGTAIDDFDTMNPLVRTDGKALIYQNQEIFNSKFPNLPTLPSFLSLISTSKPRSFGHYIPSKDHKNLYLNALSWLIRYGYLTQLLSFVWIRVDRSIKIAVDEDLEREGFRKKSRSRKKEANPHDNVANIRQDESNAAGDLGTGTPLAAESDGQDSVEDDMFESLDYTIILDPMTATALEKRWLYKCVEGQPADIQLVYRKVVKYLNGCTPLEWIVLKEIASRNDLKKLLNALGKYAVEVRHW